MKIHFITVGKPKLDYAKEGWQEYINRLQHYHQIRVTHLPDRHNDALHILQATGTARTVGLVIEGTQMSSEELSDFLKERALTDKEISFMIGGPEGLPQQVIDRLDYKWSLSKLTFPHDLAMVVMLEALYRASTIAANHPYHK